MKQRSVIVVAIAVYMIVAGCCATKTSSQQSIITRQADTVIFRETIKLDTIHIAADSTQLYVPLSSFNDSGVTYLERSNGRATVKIQRIRDVIYASAHCDSLEKVIALKDQELYHLRSISQKEQSTEKRITTKYSPWLQLLLICPVVGVILFLITKIFKLFTK